MRLESELELADAIRKEVKSRFLSLDPEWAVNRHLDKMYENSKKIAEILVCMVPEIIRSQRIKRSRHE
jgi:hypothetical protein